MPLFDGYVAVDWSAQAAPAQGANSIWIAHRYQQGAAILENPATRQEAITYIDELLTAATHQGHRLLCGFDFSFGYPVGTARMLTGRDGWEAVWERIAGAIWDDPNNRNNRFHVAAQFNRAFQGDGPFWGLPNQWEIQGLQANRPQLGWRADWPHRYAEEMVPQAQEVWQLYGAGTVGSQALTGIAALEGLRHRTGAQVWPFQTLGAYGVHVLAEIYPSLINSCPINDFVLDARQVRAVSAALQELDNTEELTQYLRAPLGMPDRVRHEEGAILGMHDPDGFEAARLRVQPCC